MNKLFGTAGIRGPLGKKITRELIVKISQIYEKFVIGYDCRPSSKPIKELLIGSALLSGAKIKEIGRATTPYLAYSSKILGIPGIEITASHNPIEHNGFKFFRDGKEIDKQEEENIENLLDRKKEYSIGELNKIDLKKEYLEQLKNKVEIKEGIKVVVDSNGPTHMFAGKILRELGAKVIEINSECRFNRPSEPKKGNLDSLEVAVKTYDADIGIAFDGDGDRAVMITKNGFYGLDEQLALMSYYEAKKYEGDLITTVEAGIIIDKVAKKLNKKIRRVAVGSNNIAEQNNLAFGGEPAGEYIFKDYYRFSDGLLTALRLVEIAGKIDVEEFKKEFKGGYIIRDKIKVENKDLYMEKIKERVEKEYSEVNKIDGLRIRLENGWALIRKSGTEDIIRITIEGLNKEYAEKIYKDIKAIL